MRGFNATAQALLEGKRLRIEFLYRATFTSSTLLLWTGRGDLEFENEIYSGNGWLQRLDGWKESLSNEPFGQVIELTGVPQELINLFLTQSLQSSECDIHILIFNTEGELADSEPIFSGQLDRVALDENPNDARLSVSYESRLIRMNEQRERRFTAAELIANDPNDKGGEYFAQTASRRIYWGRPEPERVE